MAYGMLMLHDLHDRSDASFARNFQKGYGGILAKLKNDFVYCVRDACAVRWEVGSLAKLSLLEVFLVVQIIYQH
jgi:hypothetical protein